MKLITQIYIDTSENPSDDPIYERLELFDYESVELTSSIQDVRDIGSVFTDFSQSFNVPASQVNNKALKHYYNSELGEGFDARIKKRGYISLNGIEFKNGYFRLTEVSIKNGRPSSYNLTFFGAFVNLKDVLAEDELSDLVGLSKYNHSYSGGTVYNGFVTGLGLIGSSGMQTSANRDIVYPAISATNRWVYDPAKDYGDTEYEQGFSTNIYYNDNLTTQGIDYRQLKPAIRLKHIITAIEETYGDKGIKFSNDFFNDVQFYELYLLLHRAKGAMYEESDSEFVRNYVIGFNDESSDFKIDASNTEVRPIKTRYYGNSYGYKKFYYDVEITLDATNFTSLDYDIELLEGRTVLDTAKGITNQTHTITYRLEPEEDTTVFEKTFNNLNVNIKTEGGLSNFNLDLRIIRYEETDYPSTSGNNVITTNSTYSLTAVQSMINEVVINQFLPKIKVYDFLKGLFNMFNLTGYVEDGEIKVKELNKFYEDGSTIDISNQVTSDEVSIKRMELYDDIDFSFQDPKTFGTINQNERNQDNFGNLDFKGTVDNVLFDGTSYKIKLPFEKLFFDRLQVEDTNQISTFGQGWLADDNQESTSTAPVLFYNISTTVSASEQYGFRGYSTGFTQYNRPSNTSNGLVSSIHFGEEFDEYFGVKVENSLFHRYYRGYIQNLFDKRARIYNYTGYLSLNTLLSYKMYDTIVVNNREFFINEIRSDLTTGKSNIELITKFDTVISIPADTEAPFAPFGVLLVDATYDSVRFIWSKGTDNVAVTGYEVWLDDVFLENVGIVPGHRIRGLSATTTYSIKIRAFDAQGNLSTFTTPVNMTTTAVPDTTPPADPTNLVLGIATSSSIGFSWDASTDNIGVTGYKVYVDSVFTTSTTNTSANVIGLSSNTSYNLSVSAIDAAGNESVQSNIIVGTTTP